MEFKFDPVRRDEPGLFDQANVCAWDPDPIPVPPGRPVVVRLLNPACPSAARKRPKRRVPRKRAVIKRPKSRSVRRRVNPASRRRKRPQKHRPRKRNGNKCVSTNRGVYTVKKYNAMKAKKSTIRLLK